MPRAVHMLMINDYMLANPALTVRSIRISRPKERRAYYIVNWAPHRTGTLIDFRLVLPLSRPAQASPAHPVYGPSTRPKFKRVS